MELRITATGDFSIVYDGTVRPYALNAAPGEPGRFLLDEKNGIVLEGFLDGDTLHFAFDADGTLLVTRYTLEKAQIRYEVRTYKPGTVNRPEDTTNKITSLRHSSVQRAVLKRQ
jgi:hypothetical protein